MTFVFPLKTRHEAACKSQNLSVMLVSLDIRSAMPSLNFLTHRKHQSVICLGISKRSELVFMRVLQTCWLFTSSSPASRGRFVHLDSCWFIFYFWKSQENLIPRCLIILHAFNVTLSAQNRQLTVIYIFVNWTYSMICMYNFIFTVLEEVVG